MGPVDAAKASTYPVESFDFTEEVILAKAPDFNGVFGLFRTDSRTGYEELVLVDAGILRPGLLMALRRNLAPNATRFRYEVCSVGPPMDDLLTKWVSKLPKSYGKKWKPLGKTDGAGG